MPATMPALQYRHEAPPRLVAEAPHPVVHTGGGYYPRLASTFPAPRLRPSCVYCLLLRTKALTASFDNFALLARQTKSEILGNTADICLLWMGTY